MKFIIPHYGGKYLLDVENQVVLNQGVPIATTGGGRVRLYHNGTLHFPHLHALVARCKAERWRKSKKTS